MASVVLRYSGPSDDLQRALSALGEKFECTWSPGAPRFSKKKDGRLMENFGFNLCLLSDDDTSRAEAIAESIEHLEELARDLATVGQSLHGCIMDIGIFPSPDTFTMSTKVPASLCAKLATLGIDFEFTFYPSKYPAT